MKRGIFTWTNQDDGKNMTNNWTWPKLKPTNLNLPTNLNFTSGILLTSVPDVFSCRGAKWGWAGLPADCTSIFFWVKVNVCQCHKFCHIPTLKFVSVKIFRSKSNPNLVILNRSSELASFKILKIMTGFKLATDYWR